MASFVLGTTFLPLFYSHDKYSCSPSISNITTNPQRVLIILASIKLKKKRRKYTLIEFDSHFQMNQVIAAGGDNFCEEMNSTMMKKSYEPNQQLRRSLNFSGEKPSTPVLDTINYPIHMKNLSIQVPTRQVYTITWSWYLIN